MLTTLRIRNLALVTEMTLELPPGLIAITGETGTGKSILIGALGLVLGGRADRNLIRSGEETCTIEAAFNLGPRARHLQPLLETHGLDPAPDGQLIVKRAFTTSGTNRQFLNGSPTTLAVLTAVSDWLVDIHGPHDHQSLLQPTRQLAILDAFGGLAPHLDPFAALVEKHAQLGAEKSALVGDDASYQRQLDLLRFQVQEITAAGLHPEADAEIEREYHRASNGARLVEIVQQALFLFEDAETSLVAQTGALGRLLLDLKRLDPDTEALLAAHEKAVTDLQDLRAALARYLDHLDLDPARLAQLEERLDLLQTLRRKYGSSIAEILHFGEDARLRLAQLEHRTEALAHLNAELDRVEAEILRRGRELSARRRSLIPKLTQAVTRELTALGFRRSHFDVQLSASEPSFAADPASPGPRLNRSGFDSIEFLFAPNPGEPPRPLRAIASSGELARVMLGLKTVLAAEDQVPVLVFDEVDANVGGETANAVAEKLRQLAANHQVVCITHSPQVAAAATHHFVVNKQVSGDRTTSTVEKLNQKARVAELARMLGGQTEAARQHAAALLKI